jgi:hypothetical protein
MGVCSIETAIQDTATAKGGCAQLLFFLLGYFIFFAGIFITAACFSKAP